MTGNEAVRAPFREVQGEEQIAKGDEYFSPSRDCWRPVWSQWVGQVVGDVRRLEGKVRVRRKDGHL